MDASTRWETEAIRAGSGKRGNPPRPTSKRPSGDHASREWVTLKEAEAATGIPTNTLRKWVRKDTLDTYLESDGEIALRMVDLGSVRKRAAALGREVEPPQVAQDPRSRDREPIPQKSEVRSQKSESNDGRRTTDDRTSSTESGEHGAEDSSGIPAKKAESAPPGTMLVPVDAWNKMLSQLGNLHEAGQQLAEARERAAKAETEATFLRERLREMRKAEKTEVRNQKSDELEAQTRPPFRGDGRDRRIADDSVNEPGGPASLPAPTETSTGDARGDSRDLRSQISDSSSGTGDARPTTDDRVGDAETGVPLPGAPETTTYWRYLTTGWRDRKRKR